MTYAEVYLKNLHHNLKEIKKNIKPDVKMCVAVKADGYGHGAVRSAFVAIEEGAEYLAVAAVQEGIELREAGVKVPLLMLSMCSPSEFEDLFRHSIIPFAGDSEYIRLLDKAASAYCALTGMDDVRFPVHLAVDSGMGRVGCHKEEAAGLARQVVSSEHLALGGMCTHFAVADSISDSDREYTGMQYRNFMEAVDSVRSAGINPGICHCSSSAALLDHPEWQMDMVRPGIIAYGYYPDEVDREYLSSKGISLDLKPVMALVSGVSVIRHFQKGMSVSYGHTWTCDSETDICVLPAGYADGLLRRFAGLEVAINGKPYPVRGRICMDQCMVDIGNGNDGVKRWDKAVIFGPEESGALQDAQVLADKAGTISYEVLTSVTKRVRRVYIG